MLKTTITTKQPIEIPIQYKNVYTAAIATMHCVTLRRVCHQKNVLLPVWAAATAG